ncbi:MAG: M48 family metallopeptidase [Acidobacteriota bacterium]|nr:M48 family metallopeptidase [Acidobacteriota bacterium]
MNAVYALALVLMLLALGMGVPARAQNAAGHESGVLFPEMAQPPVPVDEVARDVVDLPRIPSGLPAAEPALGAELAQKIAAERKVEPKYDVGRIGMRGVGGGVNFYSIERETAMGRELAGQVEGSARLLNDPVVTEYVNRLGQNLVRNSDARVPFLIKVIDSEEVNAFALPGGFFYVNSGLILAADNEAELAGVMAHEIAHVAARHATKNATRSEIFNLASIPLIFIGGPAGYAVRQAASLLVPMSFLKFSRNAEREADLLGMEYMYAAGYDPGAFLEFFEKLDARVKEKRSFLAKAFATHPMTGDRIRDAQKTIDRYLPERDQYVLTTSEFEQVRGRLATLRSRRMIDVGEGSRPTLRKRSSGGGSGPVLRTPEKPGAKASTTEKDPPTLRKPD